MNMDLSNKRSWKEHLADRTYKQMNSLDTYLTYIEVNNDKKKKAVTGKRRWNLKFSSDDYSPNLYLSFSHTFKALNSKLFLLDHRRSYVSNMISIFMHVSDQGCSNNVH